jgi:hypothetical protein
MTRITSAIPRRLRLLLPAALIAAAATLGGNALPDTPTAYAEPKKPFNKDGYYACLNQAIEEKKKDNISQAQLNELEHGCILAGGKKDAEGRCVAAAAAEAPGRLPPGVDIQTLTHVPPADPAAPPPVVITPAP